MAGKAELFILPIQKILVLGCMGWMAGKASLRTGHGSMLKSHFLALLFMTIETEVIHPFQLKLWVLGGMGGVAC